MQAVATKLLALGAGSRQFESGRPDSLQSMGCEDFILAAC